MLGDAFYGLFVDGDGLFGPRDHLVDLGSLVLDLPDLSVNHVVNVLALLQYLHLPNNLFLLGHVLGVLGEDAL